MDRRKNYLSLILLDALEDEKESDINFILENNSKAIDPSYAPLERGITPLHYVCGMENIQLATEVAKRFLDMQADPNCLCDENLTPLHVAAVHGRQNIVRLLLQYGADLDVYDSNQKTPALYAIEECHFEVLQIMKDHIFLKKYEKRKATNLTVLTESRFENSLQQTVLNNKETLSSTPNCTSNANENRKAVKNKNLLKVTNSLDDSFSNGAENKFTPNRIHYNYDVTSPYYINITHRRHNPQPKFPKQHPESIERNINAGVNNSIKDIASISAQNKEFSSTDGVEAVNIFSLTMQNLTELTERTSVCEKSRFSLIQSWRDKVQKSSARQAVIKQFDNVVDMIDQLVENDNLNFTNVELNEKSPIKKTQQQSDTEADSEVCASAESIMLSAFKNTTVRKKYAKDKSVPSSQINLSQLMQNVIQAKIQDFESDRPKMNETYCLQRNTDLESSYRTAPENIACHNDQEPQDHPNTSNFIRSPKNNEYFLQMTEAYVHTDDENGLVFYETKLLSNTANAHAIQRNRSPTHDRDGDTTMNSQSINLPLDYATDTLRAELTAFGEPPGPITKTTKKLYIKKLIKYKRNITNNRELCENKKQTNTVFSVELQRTLKCEQNFQRMKDYLQYETQSMEYFEGNIKRKQMREGHLKQSFIYMLIDPRISCNLPGESVFLKDFEVWQRFLESIFYVGKGKTVRPYAHLYDAMKKHLRLHNKDLMDKIDKHGKKISIKRQPLNVEIFKSPPKKTSDSKKLDRILNIWGNGKGVVCLHVFHNILPIDAYTREAAIIDALSLQHLTNCKRGDYYGPSKMWTMKEKKYLGIALLFKAMRMYLAEGESQLSPSDLI